MLLLAPLLSNLSRHGEVGKKTRGSPFVFFHLLCTFNLPYPFLVAHTGQALLKAQNYVSVQNPTVVELCKLTHHCTQ